MQSEIEELYEAKPAFYHIADQQVFFRFKTALE